MILIEDGLKCLSCDTIFSLSSFSLANIIFLCMVKMILITMEPFILDHSECSTSYKTTFTHIHAVVEVTASHGATCSSGKIVIHTFIHSNLGLSMLSEGISMYWGLNHWSLHHLIGNPQYFNKGVHKEYIREYCATEVVRFKLTPPSFENGALLRRSHQPRDRVIFQCS